MDMEFTRNMIVDFIRSNIEDSGLRGAVVGVSGGIDSALTTYFTAEAIGSKKVLGIHMPQMGITPAEDVLDAEEIADSTGIEFKVVDINPILDTYMDSVNREGQKTSPLVEGNLKARIRMSILYYYANILNRMVIGTGNRTELMLGYYTKYGDGGVDIEPIGDLYKTEVRQLSHFIGIPENIVSRVPSAGLWKGQTDEEELGLSYEIIDRILEMLDRGCSVDDVKKTLNVSDENIDSIIGRIDANRHKLQPPGICRLKDSRRLDI